MDCVIIAGGLPDPEDPIYAYTQGRPKALIDMCGRTMLERVVDALQASRHVDDVLVVGLGSDMGMRFQHPIHHLPDQGGLVDNVIAGVHWLKEQKPDTEVVMISSADIPTLTGAIVDHFIDVCRPFDKGIYYNFVTQEVMEKRFPQSSRTYVRLKDAPVAGGDIALVHADLVDEHQELWNALANARKHAWQLARTVGIRLMLKLLLRRLSLADIEQTSQRIINRPVKTYLNPHAEIAMDADKPRQVDILRLDLEHQGQQ